MIDDPRILLDAGSSGEHGWSTSSQILRCARRFRLRRAGYVGRSREPLIKGSLVHIGAAQYYAALQATQQGWEGNAWDTVAQCWVDGAGQPAQPGPGAYYTPSEAIALVGERNGPQWQEHVALAQNAVRAYQRRMAIYPEHVVAVEHLVEMAVPTTFGNSIGAGNPMSAHIIECLPSPIIHSMRIDLILRTPDGRYLVRDHKTSSMHKAASTMPFDLSGQVIALTWWGQKVYGEAFAGVEIGQINLSNGRVEFQRPKFAPHAVAEWPKMRTWIEVQKVMATSLYGDGLDWPMALSDQGPCLDRYGPCGFRDSCRLGLSTEKELG